MQIRSYLGLFLISGLISASASGEEGGRPVPADTAGGVVKAVSAEKDTAGTAQAAPIPEARSEPPVVSSLKEQVGKPDGPVPVGSDTSEGKNGRERRETRKELTETASRLGDIFSPGKIAAAVFVLIAAYVAIRISTFLLNLLAERISQDRLRLMKLVPIIRIFTWVIAIYVITVDVLSPSTNALLAFTASAGIAIGFAAQDILRNIFGGVLIILDRPFQVGDKIRAGEHYGEVVSIGLRTVRIVTPDDDLVSIPNANVVNQAVANANAGELDCQVGVEFLLPPDVDLSLAKKTVYEAAVTSRYVYLNKPVVVLIQDEFREWFLTRIKVKAYVLDTRFEPAFASEVAETAKRAFAEAGIYALVDKMAMDKARSRLLSEAGTGRKRPTLQL